MCVIVQGEGLEFSPDFQRQGEVLSQKKVKNHYVRGQVTIAALSRVFKMFT